MSVYTRPDVVKESTNFFILQAMKAWVHRGAGSLMNQTLPFAALDVLRDAIHPALQMGGSGSRD